MVTGYFPTHCTVLIWYFKHLSFNGKALNLNCNYLYSCEMGHCLGLGYFSDNLIVVKHLILMNITMITATRSLPAY